MDNNERDKKSGFLGGIIAGILLAGTVLTVIFVIMMSRETQKYRDRITALTETSSKVQLSNSDKDSPALVNQNFADKANMIFDGVVEQFYFEDDINVDDMRENMYKAIINSLGDKYAEYYTAEELMDLFSDSEGIYFGIGSYVQMDEETSYPILSGVFKDSPASRAGLRDGDIIYAVNGENIFGLTLNEAVALIKGPENTDVNLTIYREGEKDYLEFTVTRGRVESPTVEYEMKEDKIGYIKITEFDDVTTTQFSNAYKDLNNQNMESLIIDLRSNGGGNLDTVLEIAREMLPAGIITYTEDKNGHREEYKCNGKNVIKIPVVVLTNGYTASASELLTGALKDYGLATVMGTNTFGKGIVQTIYPLEDGSGLKITTSRYYTPSGVCIHGDGIAPDIEIEFDSELYYSEEKIDNQLDAAIDYLKKK